MKKLSTQLLADTVISRRKAMKLTQMQLSNTTGINRGLLSRLESQDFIALDKGIHIAYAANLNGIVDLTSINFPKQAQFHVGAVPEEKAGDWADHMRGATKMLAEKYPRWEELAERA